MQDAPGPQADDLAGFAQHRFGFVGGKDQRSARPGEVRADDFPIAAHPGRVHVGERFVHDQDRRVHGQGPGHGQAGLFAFGEFRRPGLPAFGQIKGGQQIGPI